MTSPPPRTRSRFELPVVCYAHPFELALGVAFVILGIRFLLDGDTSPSVDQLNGAIVGAWRAITFLGGIGVLVGLAHRAHPFGRTLERASCYFVAGAWAAYAVAIVAAAGWANGFASAAVMTAIAAGCFLRARAIRKTDLVILAQLRALNAEPDRVIIRRLVDGRPPE